MIAISAVNFPYEVMLFYDFLCQVPLDDLRNYYLPAFRSCVMEGHAKGVMCSYNVRVVVLMNSHALVNY